MSTAADVPIRRRNDTAVKLDTEVVRVAKIVAAYRSQSLAEYLSDLTSPIVRAHLAEEQARARAAMKPPRR